MTDIIDFDKKKREKEEAEEEIAVIYPCVCGSMFWIKTNVGDVCGFCETPFDWLEFDMGDD